MTLMSKAPPLLATLSKRIFSGFRSLCIMFLSWQYDMADSKDFIIATAWCSWKVFLRTSSSKSSPPFTSLHKWLVWMNDSPTLRRGRSSYHPRRSQKAWWCSGGPTFSALLSRSGTSPSASASSSPYWWFSLPYHPSYPSNDILWLLRNPLG